MEYTISKSGIKESYKGISRERAIIIKPSSALANNEKRTKTIDLHRKRSKSNLECKTNKSEIKKPKAIIGKTPSIVTHSDNKSPSKAKLNPNHSVIKFIQTIDNVDHILNIETRLEELEEKLKIVSSVLEQEGIRCYTSDSFEKEDETAIQITNLEIIDTKKDFNVALEPTSFTSENISDFNAESTSAVFNCSENQSYYGYPKMKFCPPSATYLRRDFTLRKPFCLLLSQTVH